MEKEVKKKKIDAGTVFSTVMIVVVMAFLIGAMIPERKLMEKKDSTTVFTVNEHKISVKEFRYYMNTMIDSYKANFGEQYFENQSAFDYVKAYVSSYLKQIYTQYDWAVELGYEMEQRYTEMAQDEIAFQKESMGEEEFYGKLSDLEVDEAFYQNVIRDRKFIDNFMNEINDVKKSVYVSNESQMEQEIIDCGIFAFKDIFFFSGENEEADLKQKEKCEKAYKRLQNGEDFDKLMFELSENKEALQQNPDGYTVDDESLNDNVVYVLLNNMEIGDVSDVVKSDNGYHIIKRVECNHDDAKVLILNTRIELEFATRYSKIKTENAKGYDEITYSDFCRE